MTSRIRALPARDWRTYADWAADYLTAALRTPWGTQRLRPIQGAALWDAYQMRRNGRGTCNWIIVGGGKTLPAALIPTVCNLQRPLLVVPGSIAKETPDRLADLRVHWRVATHINIVSYQLLGHKDHKFDLWNYRPDGIICDEIHYLNNVLSTSLGKNFARFMHEFPQTLLYGFTGSPAEEMSRIGHQLDWCLKDMSPVPRDPDTIAAWGSVLDEKVEERGLIRGPLEIVTPHLGECKDYREAKLKFDVRVYATPGMIKSREAYVKSGLEMHPVHLESSSEIEQAFAGLRDEWKCPDEWLLGDPFEIYRVAREVALGFYYRHDPRPPRDWLECRRHLYSGIREVIETSERFDSVAQTIDGILTGQIPWLEKAYGEWLIVGPTFTPRTVCEWLSTKPLEQIARWGKEGGIIWTHRTEFARALEKLTGWAYFGEEGQDSSGRIIEKAKDRTIIASVQANAFGKNLQYAWHRNLLCSPFTAFDLGEQWLGRTHREGQRHHTVYADYCVGCLENVNAMRKWYDVSGGAQLKQGFPLKIRLATLVWPDHSKCRGWAYQPNSKKKED